ncbi:hypothetical protein [Tenacibaculum maritimum]|uniref:hypothetical protein n=1 Tax=Tenacibaculum maritimum TaxID=107401 RepID=UPI001F105D74|nr:hypothetical protein [Tenacibaculum maritimum]
MNKLYILLLLFSSGIFSQNDSIPEGTILNAKKTASQALFSDDDIKLIDSLLVDAKFESPLYDSIQYVINDKDIIGEMKPLLSSELLKKDFIN